MTTLNAKSPQRTNRGRTYLDPLDAGRLWDTALGSDWPAADCGLEFLDGLDPNEPAVETPVLQSVLPSRVYQRPLVSRVDVAGRTFYSGEHGYGEGYLCFFRATAEEAQAEMELEHGWEPAP